MSQCKVSQLRKLWWLFLKWVLSGSSSSSNERNFRVHKRVNPFSLDTLCSSASLFHLILYKMEINYDDHEVSDDENVEIWIPRSGLKTEAPKIPKNFEERENWKRLIVILEQANLETCKSKKGVIELINCDDHQKLIKSLKKKLEDYRPDVTHQCLLALLDSPLNKAGMLEVFIRTNKNVLIEINPQTWIPRTFKRFSGLMAQLLTKYKVKAGGTDSATLIKIVKSSFEKVLPANVKRIGTSCTAKLIDL